MWQAAIAVGDTLAPPNMSKRYYRCPMRQWGGQMGKNRDQKKNDEFFFCVQSIYWSMAQKTWIYVLKIKLSLALFNNWVVTVWGEFHVPGKLHMDNQRRKNLTMYSIVCVLMVSTSNIFISIKNCRHQISLFPLNIQTPIIIASTGSIHQLNLSLTIAAARPAVLIFALM